MFIITASSLVLVAAVLSRLGAQVTNPAGQIDASKVQIGLAVAPVPLNLQGKNLAMVGLGSYIVNSTCVDCHSCPQFTANHNPFLGQPLQINTTNYLAGGRVFNTTNGSFISRNLTPEDGLPAGRTLQEFEAIMRSGTDFDNAHPAFPLLQVMPWPGYRFLTEGDLQAIYEYLSAIPSASAPSVSCVGFGS